MSGSKWCPHCGGSAEVAFQVGDANRRIGAEAFSYIRCAKCRTYWLSDPPKDLARYYPEDYYTLPRSLEELASWSVSESYKLELVTRFRTSGRLIEIGPASGSFLYLAKHAGFEVTAIEMDRRCCESLSQHLSVDVINSADEAAALMQAPSADVIAMWQVIEHLIDPWSMLEIASRKLNPGGVLIIGTPNPLAFQFAILGGRWVHVDAPRHTWLIPAEVIAERGERLGLKPRLVTTRDAGSLAWNQFGWEHTLMNRFKGSASRAVAARFGKLLAAAASPIESREGRGAAYTIVLQKPGE